MAHRTPPREADRRIRRALLLAWLLAVLTIGGVIFVILAKGHQADDATTGKAAAEATASSALAQASGAKSTAASVVDDNARISAALAAFNDVCGRRPIPASFLGPCAAASAAATASPITVTNEAGTTVIAPASPVTVILPPIVRSTNVTVAVTYPPRTVTAQGRAVTVPAGPPVTSTVRIELAPNDQTRTVEATVTIPPTTVTGPGFTATAAPETTVSTITLDPVTSTATITTTATTASTATETTTATETATATVTETVVATTTQTDTTTETATVTETATETTPEATP